MDPVYPINAVRLLVAAATIKLGAFGCVVWPSRFGGGPLGLGPLGPELDLRAHDGTEREFTPLHHACATGGTTLARWYLDEGAELEGRDALRHTPLLIACEFGQIAVYELLVCLGADATAVAPGGTSALMLSAENGHDQSARVLSPA